MVGDDELERSVGESLVALTLAEAIDGPETVRSAALAAGGQVMLEVSGARIMGVPNSVLIPRPEDQRNYV